MKQVNLYEAKTQLSALVDAAAAGEEIVIAKNGKPRVRLVPIDPPPRKEPEDETRLEWRLRATDVDRLRHVNNAAYWPPVEEHLADLLREPHRAVLEYRQPLDLGDPLELRLSDGGLWFTVGDSVRAGAILNA